MPAEATYQPLAYTDGEGYSGCGIRAIIVAPAVSEVSGADLSLNYYRRPREAALVKIAAFAAPLNNPPAMKRHPPKSFSVALQEDGKPLQIGPTSISDDKMYQLVAAEDVQALKLMTKMFQGETVLVGVQRESDTTKVVYSFAAKFEEADAKTFVACMAAVLKVRKSASPGMSSAAKVEACGAAHNSASPKEGDANFGVDVTAREVDSPAQPLDVPPRLTEIRYELGAVVT